MGNLFVAASALRRHTDPASFLSTVCHGAYSPRDDESVDGIQELPVQDAEETRHQPEGPSADYPLATSSTANSMKSSESNFRVTETIAVQSGYGGFFFSK